MPHPMSPVAATSAGLMLALTLATRDAAGSGFATARFGGEHGHVTTANPTALYFNPAGIALAEGIHLFADGTLALRGATWQHSEPAGTSPTPPGSAGANDGTAELFNVFGAPMLGATLGLGKLTLGAAIFVPFGGRARWS